MFHDTRSPYQRAQDQKRCPTCGHRPQDEYDRLVREQTGSGGISLSMCPTCSGSGYGRGAEACPDCEGSGRVVVATR